MYALNQRIQRGAVAGASAKASRKALSVVAFRDDDKYDLKRGARNAKQQGKNIAGKGKQAQQDIKWSLQKNTRQARNRVDKVVNEDLVVENSPVVYIANTIVLGLAAGYASSQPEAAAKLLFQTGVLSGPEVTALVVPLVRILSLGLSSAAVSNYVQSYGAQADELDDTLHKRLNASLSTFSIAQLALAGLLLTPLSKSVLLGYNGTQVLNGAGVAALGAVALVQLYVAGVNYARNSPEGYNAIKDAQSWLKDAANTFSGINGPASAGYAITTAGLLAAGLGYLVAPYPTLLGVFGGQAANTGPESIVLWQLIGAGVSMLVAPATYSLKEAAAASILSDRRFKLLNIGLLTAGLGHLLVLGPRLGSGATGGPLLPIVLGTWATAALLGGVNLLQRPIRD